MKKPVMNSKPNEFYVEYVTPTVKQDIWKVFADHFLNLGYMTVADTRATQEELEEPYNTRVAILTSAPEELISALDVVVKVNAKYDGLLRVVKEVK